MAVEAINPGETMGEAMAVETMEMPMSKKFKCNYEVLVNARLNYLGSLIHPFST